MSETILFTTDKPDFYLLDQVFDSVTNPTGTIIPRPNSLVLDPVNNGLLQRVLSVDPVTNNSKLGPVFTSLLAPTPEDIDDTDTSAISIIDYGNSRFYLFYDKAENPTKLNVDKKVIILGDDAVSFEITQYDVSLQRYIPVSLYYDTDGVYRGTKVPLIPVTSANNAKVPTNCHTSKDIVDDEIYFMFIYDYAGTQCGSIKLFGKKALINNAYEDTLLITDFILEATQTDSEGFYLFPDQDPGSLLITPKVVYNDGSTRIIGIDNTICHLYGLEGFTAAYPGQGVDVLVKYFLESTQQAIGDKLFTAGTSRFLMKQVPLRVKDPGTNEYSMKILVVPTYIASMSKWVLMFYLYVINDNSVRNITAYVTVSSNFDGRMMGVDQELTLTLRIRDVFPQAASDYIYQQPLVIRLAPYDFYERYIIRDSVGDSYGIYGVDSPILPRPVLHFDTTAQQYFIPTTRFINAQMVLEAFYYKSRPLYDSSWLTAPVVPSHFTIRSATTGMLLLSAPIPLDGFQQAFSLVNVEQQNQLLGTNCIVEFLKLENGIFKVIWGSSVDVHEGTLI